MCACVSITNLLPYLVDMTNNTSLPTVSQYCCTLLAQLWVREPTMRIWCLLPSQHYPQTWRYNKCHSLCLYVCVRVYGTSVQEVLLWALRKAYILHGFSKLFRSVKNLSSPRGKCSCFAPISSVLDPGQYWYQGKPWGDVKNILTYTFN